MTPSPIQTSYKGYYFRSRTEARWAVYFDALDIKWEYEKEGYDLGDDGYYLPDFWLPGMNWWAEVKGRQFTDDEGSRCRALVELTSYPCLLLEGPPDFLLYTAFIPECFGRCLKEHYFLTNEYYWSDKEFFRADTPTSLSGSDWEDVEYAVDAARSARFEHGQSPSPTPFIPLSLRLHVQEIQRQQLERATKISRLASLPSLARRIA